MDNQVILRKIRDALEKNNEIEEKKLSIFENIASNLNKIGIILENRNLMKD